MATSDDLFAKARQLDALADDVDTCVDAAKSAAVGSGWDCDNATEVRGQLATYQNNAHNAADGIRAEATSARHDAHAAERREKAAEDREEPPSPVAPGPGRAAV